MATLDADADQRDTFERSCAHWSEDGREEMESFYVLAGEDYRQLALAIDWASWLRNHEVRAAGRRLRLLDAACGSGKFPRALLLHGNLGSAGLRPIDYDLLDPTAFSLKEARSVLQPPFQPAQERLCRLQDLVAGTDDYDIVSATHALYALPPSELREGLQRFVSALAPHGAGFIAHACKDAHYLKFYDIYLESVKKREGTPYSSAEEIVETLNSLGVACETRDIVYDCRVSDAADRDVEGYLQRCLFDATLDLTDMMTHPALGPYLKACKDAGGWRFSQHVKMIFFWNR